MSDLSVRLADLEKKVDATSEATAARFLALEREDCLGKLTITGRNVPHRTPREKLYSLIADLTYKSVNSLHGTETLILSVLRV